MDLLRVLDKVLDEVWDPPVFPQFNNICWLNSICHLLFSQKLIVKDFADSYDKRMRGPNKRIKLDPLSLIFTQLAFLIQAGLKKDATKRFEKLISDDEFTEELAKFANQEPDYRSGSFGEAIGVVKGLFGPNIDLINDTYIDSHIYELCMADERNLFKKELRIVDAGGEQTTEEDCKEYCIVDIRFDNTDKRFSMSFEDIKTPKTINGIFREFCSMVIGSGGHFRSYVNIRGRLMKYDFGAKEEVDWQSEHLESSDQGAIVLYKKA